MLKGRVEESIVVVFGCVTDGLVVFCLKLELGINKPT